MKFRLLASAAFSAFALSSVGTAWAQNTGPAAGDEQPPIDKVTVTATRSEKRVDEVPVTVTVIDDRKIEDELATDIKDLVRFEPGVSVRNSPARFGAALGSTGRDGNSGFNIRGLEGNRVLIQTDGIRVPDSYLFGPQSQGRGDYVDLDLLKSVEILRGPASALYGSDGMAGAVSFITRDPDDLVRDGNLFGIRARSAYASADDSIANSIIGAFELGQWSTMLAYTRRDSHEQENQGENAALNSSRTVPNPTDSESNSYLGKIVWEPTDTQRFRFTYDRTDRDTIYEVYSGRAIPPTPPAVLAPTAVIDLDAADTSWRERFSLDHSIEFGESWLKSAQWAIYTQAAKTRQFTDEDRNTAADRIRDTTFDNRIWGFNGQINGSFDTGAITHNWIAGADYSSTRQSSIRTGTVPPAGESFPTRPFPTTDYELTGVFFQDEISLLDGALVLYPALRYDAYELTPERDVLYPSSQPATPSDDGHVSPKFGVVVWPVEWFGAFFNYAAGYKAPAPSQVNNGFFNPIQSYTSIANPDLQPETSNSVDVGLRVRNISLLGGDWSGSVTAFDSEAKNFIEQVLVGGQIGNPANPGIFQYINLAGVQISGIEGRLDAAWDNGFGFTAAASFADGDARNGAVTGPLESVEPFKLVAGITFNDPGGTFGGQAIVTYSDGKEVKDVATPTLFLPPDFTILDITAYWNITDWLALRVGAFNVTDEKYWWWGDVRGVGSTSITRDAYTQPGANYSASLTFRY